MGCRQHLRPRRSFEGCGAPSQHRAPCTGVGLAAGCIAAHGAGSYRCSLGHPPERGLAQAGGGSNTTAPFTEVPHAGVHPCPPPSR
jgi:hypothetical protein